MKDIDQTRRDNMAILEREAGSPTEAAQTAKMSTSQWVNLRNGAADSKTTKPRGMRKGTARKIERFFSKPEGWLDTDHVTNSSISAQQKPVQYQQRPQIMKLVANAEKLSNDDIDFLVAVARLMKTRTAGADHEQPSPDSDLFSKKQRIATTKTTIIGEDGQLTENTPNQQKYQ